jgi:hypothetical protein
VHARDEIVVGRSKQEVAKANKAGHILL